MNALRDVIRRAPPLETAIVGAALVLLVALSLYRAKAAPQSGGVAFSSFDAGGSGYRAFYELLRSEGLHVDRFEQRPAFLDAGIDTLVWAQPLPFDGRAQRPTSADLTALIQWIHAGGRLLYLQDGVGIGGSAAAASLALPLAVPARPDASGSFVARSLAVAGLARVVTSQRVRWRVPRHGAMVLIDDGRGALVIRYALGHGFVTAALTEDAFTNAAIARGDNARLGLRLAVPRRRGAYVSFDEMPHGFVVPEHWWQIVPKQVLIALALAALACGIALVGSGIRLGPPMDALAGSHGAPPDFIESVAALLLRRRAYRYALAAAQVATLPIIARAVGLPAQVQPAELQAYFRSGADAAAWDDLLEACARSRCDELGFVRGVGLAQRLRKEYAAHGSPRS